MFENIRLSLRGIMSHKMRSFLTMLGIIIGIAAIIAIVSTIQGANEQIKQNLVGAGSNAVTVSVNRDGYPMDFSYGSVPDGIPMLDDTTRKKLEALDTVEAVSFYNVRHYAEGLYYLNSDMSSCAVYGIDQSYFDAAGYHLVQGRGFTEQEFQKGAKVCLLDSVAVDTAFEGENPIGKIIDFKDEPVLVIGIVEEKNTFEPVIRTLDDWYTYSAASQGMGHIFLPQKVWPTLFRYDEPYTVLLRATSTDDMTKAGADAAEILNATLQVGEESTITYQGQDLLSQAQDIQNLSRSTNVMLIAVASISLIVGGIGVMNIMLVSVTERTREIGLKKALGANKKRILAQFLTEATVLSMLGGLLGVIVGIILANVIAKVAFVPVSISGGAIAIAVAFSMLVGVVFGLLPSVKAANLHPIDALRYE